MKRFAYAEADFEAVSDPPASERAPRKRLARSVVVGLEAHTSASRRPRVSRRLRFYGALIRAVGATAVQRTLRGKTHPEWTLAYEFAISVLRVAGRDFYDFGIKLARQRTSPVSPSISRRVERRRGTLAGLDVEIHTPRASRDVAALPVVLFLHGGGYVTCSPRSHRDVIARIAERAQARCIAPDYRLAPAHPFPAGLEDVVRCYHALLAAGISPNALFFAGDSAGGGLAVALLLRLRELGEPLPRGVVLLSPWVDLTLSRTALEGRGRCDYLGPESLSVNALEYAGRASLANPLVSPLYGALAGLPPIHMETGEWEIMLEQNQRFAARIREANGDVRHHVASGMLHAFPCFAAISPAGLRAIARVGEFIQTLAASPPA